MTQIFREEIKCAICGHPSTHDVVMSMHITDWPDLDGRHSGMERSIFALSIQRCPSCGYCAPDISKESPKAREAVQGQAYCEQLENPDFPPLANSFLCKSMISEKEGDFSSAGWASLKAAWACDDRDHNDGAKKCRLRAVEMFKKAMDSGEKFSGMFNNDYVMLTDLLRRAERFDEALAVCEEGLAKNLDEQFKKFLEFEKALIEKGDSGSANSSTVLFAKVFRRIEEKGVKKKVFTRQELDALIEESENESK